MLNALTIDLEDWAQAVIDPSLPVTPCVVDNTRRLLDFLDRQAIRATFFVLGKVCEAFPALLPEVASAGHEIASHGYGHQLVFNLTPEQFRADLRRSIALITAQTGRRPAGYRAPAFSITGRSRWAGPILAEEGFRYGSSIFPIRHPRYGIPDAPRFPYHWRTCDLLEFPITTTHFAGRNWPIVGGGYTRLLPAWLANRLITRLNRQGRPAVIYLHPYEIAPGEVAYFRRQGVRFSRRRGFTQALWRSRVLPRLRYLLSRHPFGPMDEVLASVCLDRNGQTALPSAAPAENPAASHAPARPSVEPALIG